MRDFLSTLTLDIADATLHTTYQQAQRGLPEAIETMKDLFETVAKPRIISRDSGYETCIPGKTWAHLRSGKTIIYYKQRVIIMPVCALVRAFSVNKRQHRYLMPH